MNSTLILKGNILYTPAAFRIYIYSTWIYRAVDGVVVYCEGKVFHRPMKSARLLIMVIISSFQAL